MKTTCLLFLPLLCFTSCATIIRGPHDKLYVNSEPSGAEVQLSSGERGVTPAKFVKKRREHFSVTVSKAGYLPQTVKVESKMSGTGGTALAGNIIAGGGVLSVVGIGVDASTGALYGLYPNPVIVRLVAAPTGKASKKSTTSSARKPASKTTTRASSSQPKAAPKPSPTPENFPPIHSAPAPESSPPPAPANSPTPYSPPPVLQSVPEDSPRPH